MYLYKPGKNWKTLKKLVETSDNQELYEST